MHNSPIGNRAEERLSRSFFDQPTLSVAQQLLGKCLVLENPEEGFRLSGLITETEAYIGAEDLACHAKSGRTTRNASLWGSAGHAYVYFIYGMHWMLNFVTERKGFPAAVLLRGLWPLEGVEILSQRRKGKPNTELCNGPAKICQAFNIDRSWDGLDLCSQDSQLYLTSGSSPNPESVTISPRVGLFNVPEPWKSIEWRFQAPPNIDEDVIQEGNV
jgi:DNA-3-methyladenine glycosylase